MRITGLAVLTAMVSLVAAPTCPAAELPAEGQAGAEESPIGVVGQVQPRPELQMLPGVAGWVINGTQVLVSEIEGRAGAYHGPYILQDMVAELLLRQEAARRGITVTEEEVQRAVAELRGELGLQSEVAFASFLRAQRATPQWFRDKARAFTLMQRVLGDQVAVSDREIEAYYRRNQQMYRSAETVAFRTMWFQDRASAEGALADLRQGRSFQEVAKATAATAGQRAVAGELQYCERGQPNVPPELAAALFAAPLNQVAGPVEVMGGFYLIKVERRIDPHQFTLDEIRNVIQQQLARRKLEEVLWPRWIQQQLNNASIAVLPAPAPSSP